MDSIAQRQMCVSQIPLTTAFVTIHIYYFSRHLVMKSVLNMFLGTLKITLFPTITNFYYDFIIAFKISPKKTPHSLKSVCMVDSQDYVTT